MLKVCKGCRKCGSCKITKAEAAIWLSAFAVSRQLERCITAFWTGAKSESSNSSGGKGCPIVISAGVGVADLPHRTAEGIASLIFEAASGTTTARIAGKDVNDDSVGYTRTGTDRFTASTGYRASSPVAPGAPGGLDGWAGHFLEAVFNFIAHVIVVHEKLLAEIRN